MDGCSRALGLPSKVALRARCTVLGRGFHLGVMAPPSRAIERCLETFWLSQLEGNLLDLVGGGQGCC